MLFRQLVALSTVAGLIWFSQPDQPQAIHTDGLQGVGVNLAGAEFGVDRGLSNQTPGTHGLDYHYNGSRTIQAIADKDLQFIRLPFRWERVQPQLAGPLNFEELARIETVLLTAQQQGLVVLLDLHNYGRYRIATPTGVIDAVIDQPYGGQVLVDRNDLADVWRRLAARFADSPVVVAYGLMNEPHDLGDSNWREISQLAVDSIRQVDSHKCIVVPGDGWSSAPRFTEFNGPEAWIDDPADNVAYEAHCYFDHDAAGKYVLSYDQERQRDPQLAERGAERLGDFLIWLQRNNVPGVVGEMGVPTDDPRWCLLLADATAQAAAQNVPVCLWSAGEWWGEYRLSLQGELLDEQPPVTIQAATEAATEVATKAATEVATKASRNQEAG